MSNTTHLFRFAVILNRINRVRVCSYEDLLDTVRRQSDVLALQDDELRSEFSKRTLQRDIKAIKNLFGIDIAYSKAMKGYHFSDEGMGSSKLDFLLDAFQLLQVFGLHETISKHMFPDTRKQPSSHLFRPILEAVKSRCMLEIVHRAFGLDNPWTYFVAPYGLKESQGRWYLVAEDDRDGLIKTFALDRISEVRRKDRPFSFPEGFDLENHFKDCFGIIKPLDDEPVAVELWVSSYQAPYLLTLPLHHSQIIKSQVEDGVVISLFLYPTYDFILELRKYGPEVSVLSPPELKRQVEWWNAGE